MMQQHTGRAQGSIVAVLALVVAGIALIFALAAYDRSGREAREAAPVRTQAAAEEADDGEADGQSVARARAESRLAALEARLAAQEGLAEAAEETRAVRADLQEAYQDASEEARGEWRELDGQLERLEAQLREESADALLTLQNLLARLRRDVATDDND
jgi:hypothetical protein